MSTTTPPPVIPIIIPAIPLAVEIPLFICLLKQFCCSAGITVHLPIKCTGITAFIFSICFVVNDIILATCIGPPELSQTANIVFYLNMIASLLTIYSVYTMLLLRLYYTFRDSIYRVKSHEFFIHAIIIVITLAIMISLPFLSAVAMNYCVALWIILLTMGYVHLLYEFNHNLFLLILSRRKSAVPNIPAVRKESGESVELDIRQLDLLSTMRKHSILGCFMVLTNLSFVMTLAFGTFIYSTVESDVAFLVFLHTFIASGPLCIYLGFKQNADLYEKCCNLCDRKCKKKFITLAENRLKRINEEIKMLDK